MWFIGDIGLFFMIWVKLKFVIIINILFDFCIIWEKGNKRIKVIFFLKFMVFSIVVLNWCIINEEINILNRNENCFNY